jgi:hypothetical protein
MFICAIAERGIIFLSGFHLLLNRYGQYEHRYFQTLYAITIRGKICYPLIHISMRIIKHDRPK